jgi:MFS family permease
MDHARTGDYRVPAAVTPAKVRGAWWATVVLFLQHGLVVSTWVSRIPAIKSSLAMPNGIFGLTLLSSAFGAVAFIPVAGIMIGRYGSKLVAVVCGVGFCLSLIPLALAPNVWALAASLFVYGAFAASMDVSMNAQGVEVEREMGKPTMSRFHGMFSLGGMVGASLGGLVAAHGFNPLPHFAVSACLNIIATVAVFPLLLDTHNDPHSGDHRLPFNKIPPVLFALSAIGFCILLAEGAMADWTAVYLRQNMHAGEGTAAAGYAVFSASMAICRLMGDFITARLGPLRTVRTASLLAGFGLTCALAVPKPEWALPGFAIAGMGFSVIIPLVFGGGGRVKGIKSGAGIATVTGIGYIGFIVGPPAIGFASDLITLRFALGIVVACCVLSALLAGSMKALATGAPEEAFPDNPAA